MVNQLQKNVVERRGEGRRKPKASEDKRTEGVACGNSEGRVKCEAFNVYLSVTIFEANAVSKKIGAERGI